MIEKDRIELLDSIKNVDLDMKVNVLSIIDKGIAIRERKHSSLQDVLFLIFALILFAALIALTIIKGPVFIFTIEIISVVAMPFILIPITKTLLKEVR